MSDKYLFCKERLKREIHEFMAEGSEDIHIVAEEEDITTVHALIRGPVKTPYENGFFYFTLKFDSNYPFEPPMVSLRTRGGLGRHFRPNNGLNISILGVPMGLEWLGPCGTISTILLSIQSLMAVKPILYNPDSWEEDDQQLEDFNAMIEYETIRVAVIGMLDNSVYTDSSVMPPVLKEIMISNFKSHYQYYENFIQLMMGSDGQAITDPFHDPLRPEKFEYKLLLQKLLQLKEKYGITDEPIAGQTPEATPLSTSPSVSPSASTSSATETRDPLLDSYNEIAAKMIEKTEESKPREKSADQMDSWDDLFDDMNEDLNDKNMFEDYSEEESDAEDHN